MYVGIRTHYAKLIIHAAPIVALVQLCVFTCPLAIAQSRHHRPARVLGADGWVDFLTFALKKKGQAIAAGNRSSGGSIVHYPDLHNLPNLLTLAHHHHHTNHFDFALFLHVLLLYCFFLLCVRANGALMAGGPQLSSNLLCLSWVVFCFIYFFILTFHRSSHCHRSIVLSSFFFVEKAIYFDFLNI